MRPPLLDPLFAPATSLDGIGNRIAGLIANVVPADLTNRSLRVGDLLFILPHSLIDRTRRPEVAHAPHGATVTLQVTVARHQPPPRGKKNVPYRVFAFDETGEIALTFFHAHQAYLERLLPVGAEVLVSGRMDWFNGRPSMVHPDYVVPVAEAQELPALEPVYPLTAGLSPKVLRRAIQHALTRLPDLPEWQNRDFRGRLGLPGFKAALAQLHDPKGAEDISPEGPAWRRLAYDEFLASQLSLALVRARARKLSGRPLTGDGRLIAHIRKALPYSLTPSQEQAVADILSDLAKETRML